MEITAEKLNQLTERIIHAAIKVHRVLGPGLLESAYRECLAYELRQAGCHVDTERELPLTYEDPRVRRAYRIDLLVEETVVIEVKSIERFEAVHEAQMRTYLRLSGCHAGLILNFNKETLVAGLKRMVLNFPEEERSAQVTTPSS